MEFVPSGTSDKLGTIQRRLAWPLSSTMTRTNREMVQFCPSSALMLRSLLYFFGRSDGGDVQMRFFELRVGNVDSRRKTDNLIVDSILDDCKDYFDLNNTRWTVKEGTGVDLFMHEVIAVTKDGTIRIGLNTGGGVTTFAVRMKGRNITILSTY
ncbi:uncharacterized protein LOC107012409 isoform X1 [Solanum pennellii]|uniref:Uncharacterized protein LOC107012409 isoform X1 n=1 Tax=Solanum pennellii TaxID=28526 RepID=A0ABM1G981_SOLPN|nr:uncharacterized protein LOC107012409 isoform X1 [Solanum pennellii]